ncbi:murein biosynthesis integral membrane protein MurJ [Chloroflexota bacterium]
MTNETSSTNRQIARAAGTVMVALVLSNLANLVSLILMGTSFGTKGEMDAFLAANRVSETLFVLMAGGALGSAFIPTFTGLLTKGKREKAWKLASAIANLVLIILTLAAVLAAIFAEPLVRYVLAPGFAGNPAIEALTVDLLRVMLPSAVIFGLSGLMMGILNSHQIFFIPALTPAFYRLGMIFGILFLSPRMGIFGLAWGVVIGAALHLVLQIPSLLRLKGQYFPTLGLKQPAVREVGLLMAPRLFGVAAVQLNLWVNTRLASRMVEGSVTGVSWAFTIMLMPQAIIAQAVATAALPTFSTQYALGKFAELRTSLASSLRGILLLALPATIGLIFLRQPIVKLMFEYGDNFDERSTQMVAWALLWYTVGLIGHSVVEIFSRAFYALHNTIIPVAVGVLAMALNIGLSVFFATWFQRLGWMPHGGLALANSLATSLEAIVLWVLMGRRLEGLEGRWVFQGIWQALLGSGLMGLVLWFWLNQADSMPLWVLVIGGVLIGGAVYVVILLILQVDEVQSLLRIFRQRLGLFSR